MITQSWIDKKGPTNHKTVAKHQFENLTVTTTKGPVPDLETLEPGDSFRFEKPRTVTQEKANFYNDKIVFNNGGSIEDQQKPGGTEDNIAGAVTLRSPNGESKTLDKSHFLIREDQSDLDDGLAVFFTPASADGDLWKQSFPPEGGTIIGPVDRNDDIESYASYMVAPDGTATYGESKIPCELKGSAIVRETETSIGGIVPPVPVNWLIS